MNKRILSLVLALVMVLGTFGSVFAASGLTADIEDASIAKAVSRLAAFGIVNGMEDGKYHPELDVTREQFAKLVVEATGLGSAAAATGGSTMFKDVAATRWSAGYINVASGQGVIIGYPDGTFRPDQKVTYAEAVTMLVRSLGYKDEFLQGTWPGNYVAKAAEVEITKKVTFLPSGFADRGAAAIMVNNALDAEVIKVTTYEGGTTNYAESDIILLTEKLGIDKVENIRLIATSRLDDSLNSDEIRILVLKDDTMIDGKYYDKDDEVDVDVVDDVNVEGLVGLEIVGYFDDELMVYSETVTSETGSIRGIAYDDEGDGTVYSWETGKYYDFDEDAKLFVNNEDRSSDLDVSSKGKSLALNDILKEYDANYSYAYGNLTLEKGKITFADLSVFEVVAGVVQEVDTDDAVIQYINTVDAIDEEDLNLDDYDEYNVLALDGNKMELADVEEGNRIYFYEDAEDDGIAYVMVDQSEAVEGTLTEVKTGTASGSFPRGRVYVDDVAISLANDSTYSLDEMDSFQALNRFDNLKDKFDDVFDEDVTVYKDTKGRVALLVSNVDATTDNYAVVVRSGKTGVRDELKLWTAEDETMTYEVDEFENGIKLNDIEDHDIIKYDINSDGTIDVLAIVYNANDVGAKVEDGKDKVIFNDLESITTKSVLVDGKYYFNDNSSLYFDYSDYDVTKDDEDLDVLAWADFEDTVVPNGVEVVLVTDGDSSDIQFMAFVSGYDDIASEDLYLGYLLSSRERSENMDLTVIEYGKGEVKYIVSKTADKDEFRQNIERPIVYTLSGEGIKLQAPKDDVKVVKGLVDSRSGNDLYVNGTKYVMENDVVIYEDDSKIGKYDLVKDYPVIMLLQDGKVAVIAWDYENDPVADAEEAVKALFANYTTKAALAADVNQAAIDAAKATVDKLASTVAEKAGLLTDVADAQVLLNAAYNTAKTAANDAVVALFVNADVTPLVLAAGVDQDDVDAAQLLVDELKAADQTSLQTLIGKAEGLLNAAALQGKLDKVNIAANAAEMRVALEDAGLGLDLTDYNALVNSQKNTVAADVLAVRPVVDGFANIDAVQAALDAAIVGLVKVEKVTATATTETALGATKVVITVAGADGVGVEKVLINGTETEIKKVEGKEVTILTAETVVKVEIVVDGIQYLVTVK